MRKKNVPIATPQPLAGPKPSKSKPDLSGVENLIRAMVKKHRTPFMMIRRSVLEKQFQRLRKCLPEVTPYYAIKSNPNTKIITAFVKLGAGFDVASGWEMKHVLSLGASPDRGIFATPIKAPEELISAPP